ncbi:TraR/DksA C4-type zinc finger protein [Kallotenue papyrolyticum]|uniref:TraR/DksA C4-type zinc finger protein n=1 Tax=Kallotenue papyrolyticum TaxID=1325125 RepID=UPI000478620A|nr:TraR/DksA C4-type zinc finger protein [Kallotenue papyrolyticum]
MPPHIDVQAFRRRLEARRAEIREEIARLEEQTPNINQDTGYGVKNHPAEDASEMYDRERSLAILGVMQRELQQIEHALERIDAGVYGLCEVCQQPIPAERLDARPYATLCITHQRQRDAQPA